MREVYNLDWIETPVKKMAERGRVWTNDKIRCLLAIWSEDTIQRELNGCYRKDPVWQKIAQELKETKRQFRLFFNAVLNKYETAQETV